MIRLGIFLFFLVNSCFASEQMSVSVGFSQIPGVLDEQQSSPYNKLLDVITKKSGIEFNGNFFPSIRSNHFLERRQLDCIYPIVKGGYHRPIKTLFSDRFNVVTSHFFTLEEPAFSSLADASHKTVAYQRGYLFANLVVDDTNDISFVPVEDTDAALQLLKTGRADAYLEYMPDLKFNLDSKRYEQLVTDLDSPIQTLEDVMECVDSKKNREIMASFNSTLAELKANGELKAKLSFKVNAASEKAKTAIEAAGGSLEIVK